MISLKLINVGRRFLPKAIVINCKHLATEASIDIAPYTMYNVQDSGPATKTTITREQGLKYYTQMQTIRRMEQVSAGLYQAKKVRGFMHLYSGQEAVAVGMKDVLRPNDSIITSYRCHGWALLMGLSQRSILAELMGKVTGCSMGKGGSMHMYTTNFYGGNAIVAAQVPVGTGIAFAYKYRKEDNVSFTLYGDGAANQGQVFESYNMAKLWNLPVVYVCENNLYAMGTSSKRAAANNLFFTRCEYIPGILVDGMDVLAVREATRYAQDHCSKGKGPLVYEMLTYRYYGHSMADPGKSYRTRDEVQKVRTEKDPIMILKDTLIKNKLVTEQELKDIDASVKTKNEGETKKAEADPFPPLDQIASNVEVKPLVPTCRGVAPWDSHKLVSKKYVKQNE